MAPARPREPFPVPFELAEAIASRVGWRGLCALEGCCVRGRAWAARGWDRGVAGLSSQHRGAVGARAAAKAVGAARSKHALQLLAGDEFVPKFAFGVVGSYGSIGFVASSARTRPEPAGAEDVVFVCDVLERRWLDEDESHDIAYPPEIKRTVVMDNGALFLDRRAVALPVPSCEASPLQESSDEFFLRLWAVLPKTGAVAVVGVHAVEHLHRRQNLLPFIERSKVPAWPDPLDGQWLSYDVLETEGGPSFYFPYDQGYESDELEIFRRRDMPEVRRLFLSRLIDEAVWVPAVFPWRCFRPSPMVNT
mmetsp:Transcript_22551/g.69660  ORF Transcript_22551/g.69660 Transcript_22551/m.69660 type:complete len:307 (-) Transcript_22551:201-1121(-)